jgi:hypothetical protein
VFIVLTEFDSRAKPELLIFMASTQTTHIVDSSDWQKIVHRRVESLDYGSIEIVIHDARIVHVDVTERFRFANKRQPHLIDVGNKNS